MINNPEKIEYYAPGSIEETSIIISDLLYLLGSVPSIKLYRRGTILNKVF